MDGLVTSGNNMVVKHPLIFFPHKKQTDRLPQLSVGQATTGSGGVDPPSLGSARPAVPLGSTLCMGEYGHADSTVLKYGHSGE